MILFSTSPFAVRSMIGILKLAIKQGTKFELTLDGENENEFMKKFELLVSKND